jgi:uncharacterized protein
MELAGRQVLPADRQVVWRMLNDPDVLRDCIPGCQSLEKTGDSTMEATVAVKIGPVSARFAGSVELVDLVPPESFSIVGEGKGGIAGFAKGRSDVRLAEGEDGTVLDYSVNVAVGGKLAQLGGRLLDSTSKRLSAQFFDNFSRKVREGDSSAAA